MKREQLILVADGDREVLSRLSCILGREGYDVATVADGRSALLLMEEHGPDMMIMDIMIPELNGFQILTHVRKHSDVPVLMPLLWPCVTAGYQ